MTSSKETKLEKLKLWQVLLGLFTAAITLTGAILALRQSPEHPTIESTAPATVVVEERNKPADSELPPKQENTGPHPATQATPEGTSSSAAVTTTVAYDTVKIHFPSTLGLQEIKVDEAPVEILQQTPAVAYVRFLHREGSRKLTLIGTSLQCPVQQYFSGNKTIAVSLSNCQ